MTTYRAPQRGKELPGREEVGGWGKCVILIRPLGSSHN